MMFYPFLTVSLYTAREVLNNRKNNDGNWIERDDLKMRIVSNMLDFGLPLFITIFIILYWTFALVNYC